MSRLLYRGPSLEVLHEQYAKRGRIDENAPITVSHAIQIDAPVARVWAELANPAGWGRLDPDIHDVRLAGAVATATCSSPPRQAAPAWCVRSRWPGR